MGKGDKKTGKGKRFRGSYGKTRQPRKGGPKITTTPKKTETKKAPAAKTESKTVVKKTTKKTTTKKPAAKKTTEKNS